MSNTPNKYTDSDRARDEATVALINPITDDELVHAKNRRDALLDGTDEGKELSYAENRELTLALDIIDTEYARQDAAKRLAENPR